MVILKTKREIEMMKAAGEIAGTALRFAGSYVKPGISTYELDQIINKSIIKNGATPSFLNYGGFPGSSCISVNNVVIHGIPSKEMILKPGDIVSIDVGACYNGYNGDTAWTFPCGEIASKAKNLLDTTLESLNKGISAALYRNRIGDVASAIQAHIENNNCAVVTEYVGHGVGASLHEDPNVPNFGHAHRGILLDDGMTIAIEPMVIAGSNGDVRVLEDGWTVVSKSGELAAHFEHTIAITENEPIILTRV